MNTRIEQLGSKVAATALAAVCLVPGGEGVLAASQPEEQLLEAWRNRQNEIQCLDLAWTGIQFERKGSAVLPPVQRPSNEAAPPNDVVFKISMRFTLDSNGRTRLNYEGNEWSEERNAHVAKRTIAVFDGEHRNTHFPVSNTGFPVAHLNSVGGADLGRDLRLLPVIIVYRPFDPVLRVFAPENLTYTGEDGVCDGRHCLVFQASQDGLTHRVWVDSLRSFLPMRYCASAEGEPLREVDISYSNNAEFGWVPRSWYVASLDSEGRVALSWSAENVESQFNHQIPDGTFRLQGFPPGTWVHDYSGDDEYIVREGGERRPILPGEFDGTNYEELLHSDPATPGGKSRWAAMVVATLILVIATACVIYLRRRAAA